MQYPSFSLCNLDVLQYHHTAKSVLRLIIQPAYEQDGESHEAVQEAHGAVSSHLWLQRAVPSDG
jgi:hypothetical protein